jgi:hypothetical protein
MDRRDALRALSFTPFTSGLFLTGVEEQDLQQLENYAQENLQLPNTPPFDFENGRTPEELQRDAELMKQKFFTDEEMKTISVLSDIIIPADEKSGSATQAKVPDFIEFIVKDMPQYQTPMRGGLRWLDVQTLKLFGKVFTECDVKQQITLIDQIAYPELAKPEMKHGVTFFNLMRNLTASGYFSSEMGWKYIDYKGNTPNNWSGVPQEVLDKYGLKYE